MATINSKTMRSKGMLGAWLLFLVSALLWQGAWAAAENDADRSFATVHRLKGEVFVTSAAGAERLLKQGDRVRVGEKIRAAVNAEALLKTDDSGMIAVRPGAEFIPGKFSARGDASDNQAVRLVNGSLRLITGWIGRTNRNGIQVTTATATIGIRGTDHEPYVLLTDMTAKDGKTTHQAGTYDKVNRGGTQLAASGQTLDIDPGKVGFVPGARRNRALMTLLLPVLLDRIPDFYVPGEFEDELDAFSQVADDESQRALDQLHGRRPSAGGPETRPAIATAPAPGAAGGTDAAAPTAALPAKPDIPELPRAAGGPCVPEHIAVAWLNRLDQLIHRRDGTAIIDMFAADAVTRALVRKQDGSLTELEFTRETLVGSILDTVAKLEGYQHRRIRVDADDAAGCARLDVKSVVIEQGKLAGKPFRFESLEHYVLEPRDGKWRAVRAESTQQ